MPTIQIIRDAVFDDGAPLVARSPARMLLGGLEIEDDPLTRKYLGPLDLVLLQHSGYGSVPVPEERRSRLLRAQVVTPGGMLVGTVEAFQDPLQPVVVPLVIITPDLWPPPSIIPVWRRVLPLAELQPGLRVLLQLTGADIPGEITSGPRPLPYGPDPSSVALAAQARFSTTIPDTAHGAPLGAADDPEVLVGMLIGTQDLGGETLAGIYPLADALSGGIT